MSLGVTTVLAALAELERACGRAALCTVIAARGSVPRHVGAKMLVYPDGRQIDTVGGGQLEARVLRAARAVLQAGAAQTLTCRLSDPAAGDPGVCGGEVTVFIEVVDLGGRPGGALGAA